MDAVLVLQMLRGRLPLVCLFAGGYLVYRLVAVHDLTGRVVPHLFGKAGTAGSTRNAGLGRVLWGLLLAPALLSFFLPNAISVLALLPLARSLREGTPESDAPGQSTVQSRNAATLACLCIIWGANIGGMGSLIGSPANLLLLAALDVFQMPQAGQITFGNWFAWSLPLTATLLVLAWICARYVAVPLCRIRALVVPAADVSDASEGLASPAQRRAFALIAAFFLYWLLDSLVMALHLPLYLAAPSLRALAAFVFTCVFVALCFRTYSGFRLLRPADCVTGLPLRGLAFLALVLGIMAVVQFSGLAKETARTLEVRAVGMAPLLLILSMSLGVMFLTEVFSNTVVATAFFGIAATLGHAFPGGPLPLMVAVSCASTCAFMTPVATPANALAFGEMRGARLPILLLAGLLLNILSALTMSLWLPLAVPFVYGG
ncbi:MAG: SLC13 family permease [Desulfovibrio sp.]|uniref:SLC13 family permease n=1 Tax=Desulfovibrio sp. 7SRBS1 TaxID=3378064 RepID=UPI003B3C5839